MTRVALTGGIGSGKSTVARLLADFGAVVVDADQLARSLVGPGMPVLAAISGRFGDALVGPDGSLDRAALAAIVFEDPDQLADLNAIMHPLIASEAARLLAAVPADRVAVYDTPLLRETEPGSGWDFVIVVEAPRSLRLQRLAGRGMTESDALARMAAQDIDARRSKGDIVINNDGDRDRLRVRVRAAWEQITGTSAARP